MGATATFLVAGAWNLVLQREHLTDVIEIEANRTVGIIKRSTRRDMLANEPERVREIIQTIGSEDGIERIRIFDRLGEIRVSTLSEEVGQTVDRAAEQCTGCHQGNGVVMADSDNRVRVFEKPDGTRILGVTTPILNAPDCYTAACHAHGAEQRVLGVLDVQLSLEPIEAPFLESRLQMGAATLVAVAVGVVAVGALVWWHVVRRVRSLTLATRRVAEGDLSTGVDVAGADEIGELGASWNAMVVDLRRAREELESWSATLEDRVHVKTDEIERAHQRMLVIERMASLGKLAAVVAHEINNPLAGIATYAKLLRRKMATRGEKGELDPEEKDADRILRMVADEADRCGRIVRNLLVFSRQQPATFRSADVREILDRSLMLVHHQLDLHEVELSVEVDPELPRIDCDVGQIQQVIVALAVNAIEAMMKGGTLAIAVRRDGDDVVLRVTDDGVGIAPEALDHVFEPFFTTKSPDEEQSGGVGLGLAVVFGIVERHHGGVEVASTVGRGTRFTVRLPIEQTAEDATGEAPVPQESAP